ncbi:MAG: hypothetical protein CL581_14980 [Alteromonadaceae bacterium]|uniref:hypothetical protein n=1 Tax=unclassified Marinobacter TaxID=83889 RepID=UPI000C59E47D|nr:hypothetical protein [Marinobacter sp. BGYM27]MAA66065.1 hypothetical protein [Alteromonadaceae bacterium]MBH86321.1 hypothetical protein [Alteromonadaceae bacterium]MDG5499303.1 hypothetical protein [Marinobacter sp. BGYM27]|tara:strand:- start:117 stop:539 length:423 start_codon:yes stop_codon:yes gene_type:complete
MSDRKQFMIVMLVAAIFVGWLGWRGVEVITLNDRLQEDAALKEYPYLFRVLRVDGDTAIMSSPRSFDISTREALKTLFPGMRSLSDNHRDWQRAERQFAHLQARAGTLITLDSRIDRVRWELDENWYHLAEMKERLAKRH